MFCHLLQMADAEYFLQNAGTTNTLEEIIYEFELTTCSFWISNDWLSYSIDNNLKTKAIKNLVNSTLCLKIKYFSAKKNRNSYNTAIHLPKAERKKTTFMPAVCRLTITRQLRAYPTLGGHFITCVGRGGGSGTWGDGHMIIKLYLP
jgi:hypothetical protein